ncbi:MAG TPA: lamin tail domain-containing protein [Candidatus Hydrogenedentes bacterium]|nr:lamin tail domain-containing protein [Candidatus Hydrogenedentota bacterium]
MPNLIEYSFSASPQLPAGRYYLTINTQFVDDRTLNLANSVDSPADMAYYVSEPGGDSILDTMMEHIRTVTNLYPDYMDFHSERRLSPAVVGQDALGNFTGMAFMQNHSIVNGIYTGFTVEIPETGELHIAVMRTKPDSDFASPLAINYFDFSQEPDHEWVELANVSDKEVDISGWRLVVEGDGGIEMTVPDDTYIAPNGYLLLGTNKYDYLEPFNTAQGIYGPSITALNGIGKGNTFNTFRANGIGLVRGTVPGLLPDQIAANWFADVTIPHTLQDLDTPFDPGDEDFVDNDGNGDDDRSRPSTISNPGWPPEGWTGSLGNGGHVPDSDVQSTVDPDILGLYDFPPPLDPARNTKSWDRIVELEIPALDNLNTPGEIGAFVLRGGIFPNYPEYDGIDNDSDDDFIGSDIYDNNGSGVRNEVGEGIDEGRLRLHPNNLIFPLNIPGAYNRVPAIFNEGTVPLAIQTLAMASLQYQTYPVSLDDPPDWRAFAEKRLFPGDNVIVSLYEGSRGDQPATRINRASHIVDSITYTELDVINRTIDDVLEYTFADGLYNADYPTMWPANTMGIDFYKSLERKHPLYNGDKHGVTNRSQPTDGRYDDWADSSQYWIREIDVTAENLFDFEVTFDGTTGTENLFALNDEGHNKLFDHTQFGSPLRMNLSQRKMENPATVDVAATTSLSEGQFEYALTDEGGVLTARRAIFSLVNVRNNPLVSPGDLLGLPHFDRIQRTRANPDTGDANSGFPIDFSALNQRIVLDGNGEIPRYTDDSVRQIMLGHTFGDENLDTMLLNDNLLDSNEIFFALDFRERDNEGADVSVPGDIFYETETEDQQNDLSNDLVQLIANTAASDALSLSVATAKVVPFDKGSFNTDWNVINQDWSPVLLFPLIGDNGAFLFPAGDPKYEQQYLFNNTLGNIIPATVNTDRWPYERRAVSYASRNRGGLNATNFPREGKEVLFIWDGNDGIENGEYDIYLGVNEDLRPLLKNTAVLNQFFGISFIYEALETDAVNMLMDIEIFTDRDGNGRVWNPDLTANGIDPDKYSDLNAGARFETLNESFEQIQNAVPDRNGFINYGAVTVENNYLAVFIRNRADSTVLNRFTRVILAPRAKTPGRLNINTLETHLIYDLQPNSDESRFFNPLIGIPGIQFGYNEFLDLYGHDENSNPSPTQVDRYSAYLDDLIDDGLLNDSFDTSDSFVFDSGDRPSRSEANTPVQYRAQKITTERAKGDNIHADGRYFESVADLVQPSNLGTSTNRLVYPSILSDLDDSRSGQNDYFMSEETRRFYEIRNRFGRMVNMITTRSDVFKIQVTVQTGTIDDVNGDGILNYRDDREFSVTSEKKASTVYER